MRDLVTDMNPAVTAGEEDFVREFDCGENDYDLAKGPVCHKHASGRNAFVPLEELPDAQVHPDFSAMYSAWSDSVDITDYIGGEEDSPEDNIELGKKVLNDRYMEMYKAIPKCGKGRRVIRRKNLVHNSFSRPLFLFDFAESYFILEQIRQAWMDSLSELPSFESWTKYSKVRRP